MFSVISPLFICFHVIIWKDNFSHTWIKWIFDTKCHDNKWEISMDKKFYRYVQELSINICTLIYIYFIVHIFQNMHFRYPFISLTYIYHVKQSFYPFFLIWGKDNEWQNMIERFFYSKIKINYSLYLYYFPSIFKLMYMYSVYFIIYIYI